MPRILPPPPTAYRPYAETCLSDRKRPSAAFASATPRCSGSFSRGFDADTPGPDYVYTGFGIRVQDRVRPSSSFASSSPRFLRPRSTSPAASYNIRRDFDEDPGERRRPTSSFGSSPRRHPFEGSLEYTPGVGRYDSKGLQALDSKRPSSAFASSSPRFQERPRHSPGPSDYQLRGRSRLTADRLRPSSAFASRSPARGQSPIGAPDVGTPGPGAYHHGFSEAGMLRDRRRPSSAFASSSPRFQPEGITTFRGHPTWRSSTAADGSRSARQGERRIYYHSLSDRQAPSERLSVPRPEPGTYYVAQPGHASGRGLSSGFASGTPRGHIDRTRMVSGNLDAYRPGLRKKVSQSKIVLVAFPPYLEPQIGFIPRAARRPIFGESNTPGVGSNSTGIVKALTV